MQQKAQYKFQKAFGLSWKEALEQGLVFNLIDSTAELGRPISDLGAEHDKLEKCETMLRFGGGFHCRKIEDVSFFKGFYTCIREQFTEPGTAIYYQQVEWNADQLNWEDFRGKVL